MDNLPNTEGISSIASSHPLDQTLSRLKATIADQGLTLFAHIDHGAGAQEVGLRMQPAHVLIFGNARAGTPLMVASPLLALDLPLKVLIWEDDEKKVWVSYTTPEFLAARHRIPADLIKNISGLAPLIQAALA